MLISFQISKCWLFLYPYSKGVPYFQAEIKPYEPDAGNAAVGNCS